MQKLFNRKNKKGFTLVELIIVIAILAILAAILVPLMVNYIKEAKQSVANANARSVYSAAAAAATILLAKNGTVASTGSADDTEANELYKTQINNLLGDGFTKDEATWSVTVDTNGAVTATTWKAGGTGGVVGTYTTTPVSP